MVSFNLSTVCEFKFDRANALFYSGEKITGRIILRTTTPKAITGIYILFVGLAKVAFDETRSSHTTDEMRNERFVSTAVETYTRFEQNLAERGELAAGTHNYSFSIPLPPHCPTSCLGRYGKVSYNLSLVVDRALMKKVFKQPLAVLQHYDLNLHPEMLKPIELTSTRTFWPSSGDVQLSLHIPFGGYVPGQSIDYTLDVDNKSEVNLKAFMMTLIQTYTFKVNTTRRHNTSYKRGERQNEGVTRQTARKIGASYEIPTVPPSTQGPHIIEIGYQLRLTVIFSGLHMKWNITVPITIGTIPLRDSGPPKPSREFIPDAKKISRSHVDRPALYTSETVLLHRPEKISRHSIELVDDKFMPSYTVKALPKAPVKGNACDATPEADSNQDVTIAPSQSPKEPKN